MPSVTNQLRTPPAAGPGTRQRRAAELRAKREGRAAAARSADSPTAAALPSAAEVAPEQMGERQRKAIELRAKAEGRDTPAAAPAVPGPPAPIPGERQRRAAELRAERGDAPIAVDEARERDDAGEAASDDIQNCGPVRDGEHVVREGECISSIATTTGHFWETIWNDPANAELREVRRNANVLLPEDRVMIPPLRRKQVPRPSEARHRFVRRGEPTFLHLRLLDQDQPRANEPYELEMDGQVIRGATDADGKLSVPIRGSLRRARLRVGVGDDMDEFDLGVGDLDPITELSGVQNRLNNLGFGCGPANGELNEETRAALLRFQRRYELPESGEPDDATRQKLLELHGS